MAWPPKTALSNSNLTLKKIDWDNKMLLKLKKESLTKQSELSAKVNNNVAMVISRTSDQEFEFGRDIFS